MHLLLAFLQYKKAIQIATTVFVPLMSTYTYAFEDYEHKLMGNLAVQATHSIVSQNMAQATLHNKETLEKQKKTLEEFMQLVIKEGKILSQAEQIVTYGDIIRCVDNYLTPEEMLSYDLSKTNKSSYTGKAYQGWLPANINAIKFDSKEKYCTPGRWLLSQQAAHVNHTHFKNDLLVSLNSYHSKAVEIAAKENSNLYGALVLNAISDHYLHDFFAPGHMVADRAHLTDTLANSIHDLVNEKGREYFLTNKPILIHTIEQLKGVIQNDCIAGNTPSRTLLQQLVAPASGFKNATKNLPEYLTDIPASCKDSSDKFSKAMTNVEEILNAKEDNERKLLLMGDGLLWRNSDGGLEQRILLLAINIISIQDVLNAYETKKASNSFESTEWSKNESTPSKVGFGYGHYEIEKVHQTLNPFYPWHTSTQYKYSPLLEFQYAYETFANEYLGARHVFSAHFTPSSVLQANSFFLDANIVPTLGVRTFYRDNLQATGLDLKINFIFYPIESNISPYVRRMSYHTDQTSDWKTSYGIQVEHGFSSMLALTLAWGKDYGVSKNIELEKGTTLSAGVKVSLPAARIIKVMRELNE